jgi:hypothetical protein
MKEITYHLEDALGYHPRRFRAKQVESIVYWQKSSFRITEFAISRVKTLKNENES